MEKTTGNEINIYANKYEMPREMAEWLAKSKKIPPLYQDNPDAIIIAASLGVRAS